MSRITHFSNKGVFLLLLGYCLLVANFVELRKGEVRRIPLPRTPVNTSRGRQVSLWQRLDAVAGSDRAAREYVGSQPAPVY
jgi:hypothetical protein